MSDYEYYYCNVSDLQYLSVQNKVQTLDNFWSITPGVRLLLNLSGNSFLSMWSRVYIGLGGRPDMMVLTCNQLFDLVCGDHKGMPKMYTEVNSLLCCASLLVSVTCTAIVKCIYYLIASIVLLLVVLMITCTTSLYFKLE